MTVLIEALPLLLLKARETSLACLRPVLLEHGLTEPQWRVLCVLHQCPDVNAQKLAQDSCILSPSLSRILNRFVLDGLVLRNISSADQRSVILKLSAKGKRLHQCVLPKIDAQYKALEAQSGPDNLRRLTHLLQDFINSSPPK